VRFGLPHRLLHQRLPVRGLHLALRHVHWPVDQLHGLSCGPGFTLRQRLQQRVPGRHHLDLPGVRPVHVALRHVRHRLDHDL